MHQRTLRALLALTVSLTAVLAPQPETSAQTVNPKWKATPITGGVTIDSRRDDRAKLPSSRIPATANLVGVIVKLQGQPLASYTGGQAGLSPTSPQVTGDPKLNVNSPAAQAYRQYLTAQRNTFEAAALQRIPNARIQHRLDVVVNGVSMLLPGNRVAELANLPGVEAIYPDELLKLQTENSPQFIGATQVWNQLGGQESAGEGIVVGVLDTGVWPEHPSFADPDPSGKAYAAPPAAPGGPRACQFTGGANPGAAFTCNNKLIGAYRFMTTYTSLNTLLAGEFTTARDDDGHGTHTSTTAAGNANVNASIFGVARGAVSGIAPRAHVVAYKVCGEAGCYSSDSAAAVQQAILDGVNSINFSISGGSSPYSDAVEQAFLDAYNAGIFVAASAGNSGPGADTTDHRGPWVTTVAASTQNRSFENKANVVADGGATLTLNGTSIMPALAESPVVVGGGDGTCSSVAAPGTFAGKIVVCKRGGASGRVQKGYNILQGGAVGMILYNNATSVTDLETDNHFLPTIQVQFADGQSLLTFIAGHTNVRASLTAGVAKPSQGDVMASFSSRGGVGQSLGVSKPDVSAPGVQVLAGNTPAPASVLQPSGELFQAIAGTSMSSPHIAGSGALMKALHPSWTPGQIKSALMTTAITNVVKEDGVTPAGPFDMGSGRVALAVAGDPGLTFDETGANYLTLKDKLWNANYPSVYIPTFGGKQTIQRSARSTLAAPATWTLAVSAPADVKITVPTSITVPAGGTLGITIEIDGRDVPLNQVRTATVTLSSTVGSTSRQLHVPITIVRRNATTVTINESCAPASFAKGANSTCTITAQNNTANPVTVGIRGDVSRELKIVPGSVSGATQQGNHLTFGGTMAAAVAPQPTLASAPGSSPGGYQPLSAFSVAPISGVGDDTISNFTVPAYTFGGETYTTLGVSSNGYLVVGGGSGSDNTINNQSFPDTARPNNVLAPFWTDLDPSTAGAIRITTLTDGTNTWIVVDWAGVREFSTAGNTHSFEVWIGLASNTPAGDDITYTYGANTGGGDAGNVTVGVENRDGTFGNNVRYDATGTLPTNGTELRVTTIPAAPSIKTITYQVLGVRSGTYTVEASMTSGATDGTTVAQFSGTVTP